MASSQKEKENWKEKKYGKTWVDRFLIDKQGCSVYPTQNSLVFRTTSIPLILVKMEIAPFFNATDGYLSFEPSLITLG